MHADCPGRCGAVAKVLVRGRVPWHEPAVVQVPLYHTLGQPTVLQHAPEKLATCWQQTLVLNLHEYLSEGHQAFSFQQRVYGSSKLAQSDGALGEASCD
eukprot:13346077-Alexandrium_andersonii.AAC.1